MIQRSGITFTFDLLMLQTRVWKFSIRMSHLVGPWPVQKRYGDISQLKANCDMTATVQSGSTAKMPLLGAGAKFAHWI
jgi:hypothetical protein